VVAVAPLRQEALRQEAGQPLPDAQRELVADLPDRWVLQLARPKGIRSLSSTRTASC